MSKMTSCINSGSLQDEQKGELILPLSVVKAVTGHFLFKGEEIYSILNGKKNIKELVALSMHYKQCSLYNF